MKKILFLIAITTLLLAGCGSKTVGTTKVETGNLPDSPPFQTGPTSPPTDMVPPSAPPGN